MENIVDTATLLEQLARESQEEAALHRVELCGEVAGQYLIERLIECGALLEVGEEAPETGERAPSFALCNDVDTGEQGVEDLASFSVSVEQTLAQSSVQLLEIVAHAMKV